MHGYKWLINCTRTRTDAGVAELLSDFRLYGAGAEADAIGLAFGQCAHIVESEPHQLAFQLAGRLPAQLPCVSACRDRLSAGTIPIGCTGACTINRPCAQQYVGKISVMHGYQGMWKLGAKLETAAEYKKRTG